MMETFGKLLPDAASFETLESGVTVGKDGNGNPVGYALAATTQGFGGEVETTVSALTDGTIGGISVGGSNFAETAGLGARAKEPEFQAQFAGKSAPVALTKDGGEIEALSGATITSRAVIKGVNEAMEGIAAEAGFSVEVKINAQKVGEGQYSSAAPGFGGNVRVTLTVDEDRTITAMEIGDSEFNETEGLGKRALEPEFQAQFIGKTLPVTADQIDGLTGATITTGAVLEAIGNISSGLDKGLADMEITALEAPETAAEEETAEPETAEAEPAEAAAETSEVKTEEAEAVEEAAAEAPAVETSGEALSASAQGFAGPVKVTLTLDEKKTITSIEIGDENFAETEGMGKKALEPEFQAQFIGKTIPLTMDDIDALAGATVTTTAVIEAINTIAAGLDGATAEEPEAAEAPAAETSGEALSASAQGFAGPVKVTLTLDEKKTITSIEIGDENFAETEGMGKKALEPEFQAQFIGKTIPLTIEDIDALTGATVTTTAVVEAINTIAAGLDGATAEEPEAAETPAVEASGEALSASAQGFAGPVKVTLTLDEKKTITSIEIGDENFAETEGMGKKALEPEFQAQFIGKTVPLTMDDIDALAGATVTTTAVVEAINTIAAGLDGAPAEETAEDPAAEEAAPAASDSGTGYIMAGAGTGITVIPATEWENTFPDVYASYMANAENEEVVEYTEQYPFLGTVYEDYGFAKYYGSARGHYYSISDLMATGRPHALANCFTCKTAQFTVMTLNEGNSAYSKPFEEIDASGFEDIGCFTCHANTPGGKITVTHSYLVDAMGEDFEKVKGEVLSCGQCHVEYYFAPDGKATSLPYTNLAGMTPDAMYEFYEAMDFADYTNPRTGVRQLKAQHPEMETFLGEGSVHRSTFTCADCHMERLTNEAGETYLSHKYVSPLESETIRQNCSACHADLTGFVHGIQEKMEARTIAIGEELETLTNRLADAVAGGKYTDEQLTEIRALNRKGQWYWDFVFVENSEGAHNSKLDNSCLDKAETAIHEALDLLDRLDV